MLETFVFFFQEEKILSRIIFFQGTSTVVPTDGNPSDDILSCLFPSIVLTQWVSGVPCYHVKLLFMGLGMFRHFCNVCGNASVGCFS